VDGDKIKNINLSRFYSLSENLISAFAVISIFLLLLTQLTWPLDTDQGFYALTGMMVLEGYKPYSDIWLLKGPVIPYLYALIINIFGNIQWAVHLFDIILATAGMVAIWYIIQKITNKFCAFVVTPCLISNYHETPFLSSQPDGWTAMLLSIMIAVLFYDEEKLKKSTAIFCGILIAMIGAIKFPYLIYSSIIFLYSLIYYKDDHKKAFKFLLLSACIAFMLISLSVLWIFYIGSLNEMLDIFFGYIPDSHFNKDLGLFELLKATYLIILRGGGLYIFFMSIAGIALLYFFQKKRFFIIFLWGIIALILIIIQNKIFSPYIFHLFPSLYIFASYFLYKLYRPLTIALGILIVTVTFSGYWQKDIYPAYKLVTGKITDQEYSYKFSYSVFEKGNKTIINIADHINNNIEPGRKIYSTDYILTVHLLTNTLSATRFANYLPLMFSNGERKIRYEKELEYDLLKNKPQFILYPYIHNLKGDAFKVTRYLTEVTRKIMHSHYYVDKVIDDYVIFKHHNFDICFEEYGYSMYRIARFMRDMENNKL